MKNGPNAFEISSLFIGWMHYLPYWFSPQYSHSSHAANNTWFFIDFAAVDVSTFTRKKTGQKDAYRYRREKDNKWILRKSHLN